jgi:positive regulator of sigma E activity
MASDWERFLPVVISICIIISIAILREYSRSFAAVAAVMPVNIPLGLWIVSAGAEDKQKSLTEFSGAVLVNIVPTVIFLLIAWYGSRSGWDLLPIILMGYMGWAISLGLVFGLKALVG